MKKYILKSINCCTAFFALFISSSTISLAQCSLSVSYTKTDVTCASTNSGSATPTATGGTAPYFYQWSNGQVTKTASGLAAGTYTLTVTDSKCTPAGANLVTNPDFSAGDVGFSSGYGSCNSMWWDPNCIGFALRYLVASYPPGNNGFCACSDHTSGSGDMMIVNGNNWPGTYVWYQTITVTPNTLYNFSAWVTSLDAVKGTELQLAIDGVILGSPTWTPTCCNWVQMSETWFSGSSTTIQIAIIDQWGINPGSTYALDDISFQVCNRCSVTSTLTIGSSALNVSASVAGNVGCAGGNTGAATANGSGGIAPYTYQWSDGETTQTATNLTAGTHTVTISDSQCVGSGIELVNNGTFSAGAVGFGSNYGYCDSYDCLAAEGKFAVGSNAPFFHPDFCACGDHTSGSGNTMYVNGAGSPNTSVWCQAISVTPNTNYNFSTWVTNLGFASPALLQFSINGVALGNIFTAPSTCCDWSQFFAVWNSGANTSAQICIVNQNTTASGNDFGLDDISFQACGKCSATSTVNISQLAILATTTSTNDNCGQRTGTVTAFPTGGTGNYVYHWDATTGNQGTPTAINLFAGTYTVTVTDGVCSVVTTASLTGPSPLVLSSSSVDGACGSNNGSGSVNVAGGTPGYSYTWLPSGGNAAVASGLAASTYTVIITDAIGCSQATSVIVGNSSQISVSATPTNNVSCNGGNNGSTVANIGGGTAPIAYAWSPSGGTNATASGLTAGTYTVSATDSKGCIAIAAVTITQPAVLSAPTSVTSDLCGNGTATATTTPNGGTGAYTYQWDAVSGNQVTSTATGLFAGNYGVTITDANNCTVATVVTITSPPAFALTPTAVDGTCGNNTGSASISVTGGTPGYSYTWLPSGGNAAVASGLAPNTYTVVIADANSCTQTTTVVVGNSPPLTVTASTSNSVSCNGGNNGSAIASIGGGTAPITYLWSPTGGAAPTATGLSTGSYTLVVTDSKGCFAQTSVTISQPATSITASATLTNNVTCKGSADGIASATGAGGTPGYTYLWSSGTTTATASGLAGGIYSVTVTDNNGCTNVSTVTVNESSTTLVSSISNNQAVTCKGSMNGTATISTTGGTPGYTYSWSSGATTATASGLAGGVYSVTVTDNNSCINVSTVTVNESTTSLVSAISNNQAVTCKGSMNGTATISATGGTPGYTYSWSSGATTATASALAGGIYSVTVTDNNGCINVSTVTVNESSTSLVSSISNNQAVTCMGSMNGTATISATGGTPGYTYSWSSGATTATASALAGGIYSVTVTDNNGCINVSTVTVNESSTSLVSSISNNQAVTCKGSMNGTATISTTGGTPGYIYSWSSGATTATASALAGGIYSVTVTDNNGCINVSTVTVNESSTSLVSGISNNQAVTCKGSMNGTASISTTGGTPGYTYSWSSGPTTATASALAGGIYSVTVTDNNGCTNVSTVTVNESSTSLVSSISNSQAVTCKGSMNGTATISTTGGTPGYTYSWSSGATTATASALAGGIYTVTVMDTYGCDTALTVLINESTLTLNTSIASTNSNCANNNGTITVSANGGTAPLVYQWAPITNTTSFATGLAGGNYTVTVSDLYGCTVVLTTTISATPKPSAGFTPDPATGTRPLTVNFTNTSTGGTNYLWLFGDGSMDSTLNTSHVYDSIGTYTVKLIVTNTFGCMDSVMYTFIKVYEKSVIVVPNVFTPNGDLTNDVFFIKSKGLSTLQVEIFSRWGMKLYEINSVNGTWDGRNTQGAEAPDGTYYYMLKAEGDDGEAYTLQGYISLIR